MTEKTKVTFTFDEFAQRTVDKFEEFNVRMNRIEGQIFAGQLLPELMMNWLVNDGVIERDTLIDKLHSLKQAVSEDSCSDEVKEAFAAYADRLSDLLQGDPGPSLGVIQGGKDDSTSDD